MLNALFLSVLNISSVSRQLFLVQTNFLETFVFSIKFARLRDFNLVVTLPAEANVLRWSQIYLRLVTKTKDLAGRVRDGWAGQNPGVLQNKTSFRNT